jgi:mRNA-degrading endonuclease RelE of RelBE toxin-antitoxin system
MITIGYSKQFLKSAKKLPPKQQEKLAVFIQELSQNPFHPSLHTKRLTTPLKGLLSFRITREWRCIFQFITPTRIQLLRVAHRKDIYRQQ